MLLSLLYLVVDVTKWWGGGPFVFAGTNSLALYIGSRVLNDRFPFAMSIATNADTHAGPLTGKSRCPVPPACSCDILAQTGSARLCGVAASLVGTASWLLIGYWLHEVKVFVKV